MAKIKDNLALDEKLKEALVADWEQPYPVPSNWVWTRLGLVAQLKSGKSLPLASEKATGKMLYLKVGDMNLSENFPNITTSSRYIDDFNENSLIPANSILFPKRGGAIFTNKKRITFQNILVDLNIMAIIPKSSFIFTYYWFMTIELSHLNNGSSVPQINNKDIEPLLFPLPPLAEQERIVKRIESLFSKLAKAKELAQSALSTFENRKSAILHQAFTGELTKNWRLKNGVNLSSWKKTCFSKIMSIVTDRIDPKNKSTTSNYIGLEHIEKNNGIISFSSADTVKSIKTVFQKGDIIYGKLRPYLNKHDIAPFDGICSTDILVYRASNSDVSNFINYLMHTTSFIDYAISNSKGINLPRVSDKAIGKYTINLPSLAEQAEIVSILDSLLEKEQKAKEIANVIEQIDHMKKAILARAFRGELDTNDPQEESARELLKEILQQEITVEKPKKIINNLKIDKAILTKFKTDFEEDIYRYIAKNQPVTSEMILKNIPFSRQMDGLQTIDLLKREGFVYKKQNSFHIK